MRIRSAILALAVLACASVASAQTPAPSSTDTGWKTIIYPVRAWLPIFGAETRLPEVPGDPGTGGGPVVPRAKVSSNFNGAAAAGFRVERWRISVDGSFLWAGMSGEIGTPFARLEVDTVSGRLFGGFRVLPNLFVDAGVRRLALKLNASILAYPLETWKPGIWQPAIGLTWRPQFGSKLRFLAQGSVGGGDNHSTSELTGTLEWKPVRHFAVGGGYGFMRIRADGMLRNKSIHLRQTLQGPTFTLGIPF
jgi:hypothetical protein